MTGTKPLVIAIDGPAASGKGTLARRLAAHFGLGYLDTGSLYRATALRLLRAGADANDVAAAAHAASTLEIDAIDEGELRKPGVGELASRVAAMPEVRDALLTLQRRFARSAPGAVLDGRDIGTVVCPDADVKLYVTAQPETRAQRRHLEYQRRGEGLSFDDTLADIQRRDRRDSGRSAAPLRAADDAILLDTTELGIEAAFQAALAHVESVLSDGDQLSADR